MKRKFRITGLGGTFLLLACVAGCGGPEKPEGLPELVPCIVKVVQEGQPLAEAEILLHQQDASGTAWTIGGITNDAGEAKIFTYGKFEGSPEGTFKVTVSKVEIDPGEMTRDGAADNAKVYDLVEPQYSNILKTPLTLDVVKGTSKYEVDAGKIVHTTRRSTN